jgi:PAS domain S-box-containing protein
MNDRLSPELTDFLAGGGEMAKLVRAKDWSGTPLGPIGTWPQSLRTTVSLCLASTFPISIAWGAGHVQIYNDGYWPICGGKHPHSMGQDFAECWASAWPVIGKAFDRGLAGEASYLENQRLFLDRNGYLEETFFTFSFSPILDETGGVGGLFHPVIEQTAKMLSERRTRALRDLAAKTGKAKTVGDVLQLAAEILSDYDLDVPFALFYRIDADGTAASLAAGTGLPPGTSASPERLEVAAASAGWPLAEAMHTNTEVEIADLAKRFGKLTCGPYPEPPHTAFVMPIAQPGSAAAIAVMVAGVSARLPLNEMYRGFYDLIAATVTAAVANAHAYEEEKHRAEALAELDRAKTTFFSNVSHEFRTPLTLMLGPLEDALGDPGSDLSALQRPNLEVAHRNALRLLKLVNTLLDFSRIEAGRQQAAFQPTDLAAVTAELASNFRSACDKAGLALTVDCAALPGPVHVDRAMWEKIVLNLLSNAFKFTFAGGIAVTLRPDGADSVKLAVRDSGIGIPEAELPRLFERFHRVESAQGRTHEGSGIGLALVQDLVKLHGGHIRVESAIGQGSVFRVSIPLGTAHLPPDGIRDAAAPPSTSLRADAFVEEALRWLPEGSRDAARDIAVADPQASPMFADGAGRPRAVLADDNADMRAYVTRILEAGGYEVVAVADGQAALAAARSGTPPDLVLSDVMMPKLDGFGLLQALRGDPALREVLVILLSARAGEEARLEGLAAGADDYMVKPFSARELRARVDGAVRLSRLRRASAARERELHAALVAEQGRAALAGSQTRLALALDSGKLGCWELDLATDTSVRTPQHDRIFGYGHPVAAWSYRTFLAHVVAEDREQVESAFRRAIETGENWQAEFRIRRADTGEISWIEVHGSPLAGADGRVSKAIGIIQDITERQLKVQSQALLAAIVDASNDAIIAKSLDGVITSWNSGAQGIFGWTAAEAVGQPIMLIIPPDRHQEEAEIMARLRAGASIKHFDTVRLHRDGSEVPVSLTISPISDARGHVIGASKVLRDVTEQRRAEQALREANETLEQRVAERTRELAQQLEARKNAEAALAQAQKMEAVGQLTGGIAHDFNNLLTVISGNLHFVTEMAQSNERLRRLAGSMLRAVDRGARLTGQLLAFARRQPLLPEVLWLDQCLRDFSTLIQRALGETVQLEINGDCRLWACEIDASQFEAAVLNLAINARDAMPEGGRLTITARNLQHEGGDEAPAGKYVAISVTDTGRGMSPEVLAHAVEPFFTTKDVGKGSGLGLSQVYGFLQQSGGALRIDSQVGKGTRVNMLFRRAEAPLPVSDGDVANASVPPQRRTQVLVVEDDLDLLDLVMETLTAAGLEVFGAHDGGEALALLGEHPSVRLMLSDVVMPNGISGVELGREAQLRRPDLKVMLMSCYPREELSRFGSTATFPFLSKPFRPSELIDRLKCMLLADAP